jgi:DNA-binding response OmpR family regulator
VIDSSESPFVLVVEDDVTICEVVEIILAEEGYDVQAAGDSNSALRLLQQREPAVILLDLTLPGDGSMGFVSAYRTLVNVPAPILVMSGRTDIEEQVAALGAAGSLAKPFDIDVLIASVRALVGQRRMLLNDSLPQRGERESAGLTCVRDRRCAI